MLLLLFLVFGSIGFMVIDEDHDLFDAAWNAANILTTVGDSAMASGNLGQRIWALVLMFAGVLVVFYVGINIVSFIVEGEVRAMLGRRQLQNKIRQLHGHYVVCGFGRMGRALCNEFHRKGTPFVLVEHDDGRAREADELGYLYINGDATVDEVLHEAQLEDASGLATCLAADADNVFVTLSARSVSRDLVIIARAERAETQEKLRRAGATRVICPPVIGAKRVLQMLMHPQVKELLELATVGPDLEVANIKMHALPGGIGKSLRELDIAGRMGVLVVAIVHGDASRSLSPPPDKPIRADDELIIAGAPGGIECMIDQLGQEPGGRGLIRTFDARISCHRTMMAQQQRAS